MHPSQHEHMKRSVDRYAPKKRHIDVLELGSATSPGQTQTHRDLFDGYTHTYFGVDVRPGPTVDAVMTKPYTIPAKSESADVVVCGSVMEHVPFHWASMLEIARVLRPGGLLFMTAPSRGHKHSPIDCWRFYPDGVRAMGLWAGLTVVESHVHYPPMNENKRFDYPSIDVVNHYWGDAVGVFRKPKKYSKKLVALNLVVRAAANRLSEKGPLGETPRPKRKCDV